MDASGQSNADDEKVAEHLAGIPPYNEADWALEAGPEWDRAAMEAPDLPDIFVDHVAWFKWYLDGSDEEDYKRQKWWEARAASFTGSDQQRERELAKLRLNSWQARLNDLTNHVLRVNLGAVGVDLIGTKEYRDTVAIHQKAATDLADWIERIDNSASAPSTSLHSQGAVCTPQLTRDQHAEVLGYDSGRSAARALGAAWRDGVPNQGVRRALNPGLLLSPVQKFRTSKALVEKWPVPQSVSDILDMYANPGNWKPKVAPKVRMKA